MAKVPTTLIRLVRLLFNLDEAASCDQSNFADFYFPDVRKRPSHVGSVNFAGVKRCKERDTFIIITLNFPCFLYSNL